MAAYRGSPLLLNYELSELGIENTGHYAEVPIPAGVNSTLLLNGDLYPLVRSWTSALIETFITDWSSTMRNCAVAKATSASQPLFAVASFTFPLGAALIRQLSQLIDFSSHRPALFAGHASEVVLAHLDATGWSCPRRQALSRPRREGHDDAAGITGDG